MMNNKTSKWMALLLAVVFAFTAVPQVFADDPVDIGQWVYFHDVTGNTNDGDYTGWGPTDGLKSEITVKDGTDVISSVGGVYADIPVGATLELNLGFHISNSTEVYYHLVPGSFFTFDLPQGLNFKATAGTINDPDTGQFATWSIVGNKLTVTFTEGILELEDDIWGLIELEGEFTWKDDDGDDLDEADLEFYDEMSYEFKRKPDGPVEEDDESTLDKAFGSYNPETGRLTWEITIAPPNDDEDFDYSGYILTDTITGSHKYVASSFKVNGGAAGTGDVSINGKTLTYTFPENHAKKGVQVIEYETEIIWSEVRDPDETVVFDNNAQLMDQEGEDASNEDSDSYQMSSLFQKSAATDVQLSADGKTAYIKWTVTLTLPATGVVYTYPNAKILDKIFTGQDNHEYVLTDPARYPTIRYPGSTTDNPIMPGVTTYGTITKASIAADPDEGVEASSTMTYAFPSGHPKTGGGVEQKYIFEYWTEVSRESNEEIKPQNSVWFEWGTEGSGGPGEPGGSWQLGPVVIEKEISEAGRMLSKSVVGSSPVNYNHSSASTSNASDYIQWKILVNQNQLEAQNLYLIDAVPATPNTHDLVVSSTQLLIVKTIYYDTNTPDLVTAFSSIDAVTAETKNGFTLIQVGNGFRLDFPTGTTRNTYEVTFFTKITDESRAKMYLNTTTGVKFDNGVDLYGGDGFKPLNATASKTYRLQMLAKSSGGYDFANRTVTYTVTVNRNRLRMTGATISDTLPPELVLLTNTASDFTVTVTSVIPANNKTNVSLAEAGISFDPNPGDGLSFKLTLPDTPAGQDVGDHYSIKYVTKLKDDSPLIVQNNKVDFTVRNNVKLTLDQNTGGLTTGANTNIKYDTLTKSDDYEEGDTVTWTVEVNRGQVNLGNSVFLKDTLQSELKLVEGSVKLFEAAVATNGTLSKKLDGDGVPVEVDISGRLVVNEDENSFTLNLPSGRGAYILEFTTEITEDDFDIVNKISLSGFTEEGDVEAVADTVEVGKRFAQGGAGSYVLTVLKLNEKDEPMSGVVFKLLNSDLSDFKRRGSSQPVTATSNSDGLAVFSGLPNWNFYVQEIEPLPAGYLSAGIVGPQRPSKDEDAAPVTIVNSLALIDFSISKMSYAEDPDQRQNLSGGTFGLYLTGSTDPVKIAAASNGVISFTGVVPGDYLIREIEPPQGYRVTSAELPVTVQFTNDSMALEIVFGTPTNDDIERDEEGGYTFLNRFDGRITIYKEDETGEPLADAFFQLLNEDGTPFLDSDGLGREGPTDSSGVLVFDELPPGVYLLREVKAPLRYALLEEDLEVILTLGEGELQQQVTVENELLEAYVALQKTDPDGQPLTGGLFGIYDPDDTEFADPLDEVQAGEEGWIIFADLLPGSYKIREIEAPAGYVKSDQVIDVELALDEELNELHPVVLEENLINDWAGAITLVKTDEDGELLAGAVFQLLDHEGELLEEAVTNGEEAIVFSSLPVGTYYLHEVRAPLGYALLEEDLEVILTLGDGELQQQVTVENELLEAYVALQKTDPDGQPLTGGLFGIYDPDDTEFAEPIQVTGAVNGKITFSDLLPGSYKIREIEAPAGYVKSDQVIDVELALDEELNELPPVELKEALVNNWAGAITLVKTDEEGELLAGAVFQLLDGEKEVLDELVTDGEEPLVFTDLPMGTYYLREVSAPLGYALLEDDIEVLLSADSQDTITREVAVENERLTASVSIMKVDQDGEPLTGGLFGIYYPEDERFEDPIAEVAADDGLILFEGLLPGKYVIREIEAPEGFDVSYEPVSVTLALNEETNALTDLEVEEPLVNIASKTGGDEDEKDDDLVPAGGFFDKAMLWVFGTILLLAGAVLLLSLRKERFEQ